MNSAKDLFQLQSELIDNKVDMAVSRAIDPVMNAINSLKDQMHSEINSVKNQMQSEINNFKDQMHAELNGVKNLHPLTPVLTPLCSK